MGERKWQMRRLGAGDYVCWSNDMSRLWRFYRYVDGQIHGLDVKYEARDFWLAAWMPEHDVHLLDPADFGSPWEKPWNLRHDFLPSRQAAIDVMLADEPVVAP